MKKSLIIVLIIAVLIILFLTLILGNIPVMKTRHHSIGEIYIIDFFCKNLRRPYEVVCETGNKDLDILCFVIEPGHKFKGTVVIDRSPDEKIILYTKDDKDQVKVYSLPDPGLAQVSIRGASWGKVYYLKWSDEMNQTDMRFLQVEIREKMK